MQAYSIEPIAPMHAGMRRPLRRALAALLAVTVLSAITTAAWGRAPGALHMLGGEAGVYSVNALARAVAPDPAPWMGRTVLVRGLITVYYNRLDPFTFAWRADLVAPGDAGSARLALAPGPADPLLALLRRLPEVGRWAPRAQTLREGAIGTFRVQLRAVPGGSCTSCYEALLLDAAPTSDTPAGT